MVINLKNTVYTTVLANNKQLNRAEKLVFMDENEINLSKIIALRSDGSREKRTKQNCIIRPTTPPPPPQPLASRLGQNVGLVGRQVGSFPDTDLLSSNETESYTLEIISKGDKQSIKLLRVCQHFLE